MDSNQNEILLENMTKLGNNSKNSKINQYKLKEQNFKNSKTFTRLPPLSNTNSNNDIRQGYNYTLRATKLEFTKLLNNQQYEYDPNILKKELSLIR